ncbi:hypothetical protein BDR22DRAFT_835550 [Usnea florida]
MTCITLKLAVWTGMAIGPAVLFRPVAGFGSRGCVVLIAVSSRREGIGRLRAAGMVEDSHVRLSPPDSVLFLRIGSEGS